MAKPNTVPGEYEVAHLTDVIHMNTIETITGQHYYGVGNMVPHAGSSSHTAAQTLTSASFWKGNLYLTNFALNFQVTEGAAAGHHSIGVGSGSSVPSIHPNLDPYNSPLLHIPVGSIWKMEYNRFTAIGKTKEERERERAAEKESSSGGDFSGMGSGSLTASSHGSADSDLKEIAFQLTLYCRDARVLNFGILKKASLASSGIMTGSGSSATAPAPSASTTKELLAQAIEDRQASSAEFMRLLKKYAFPKEVKKLFAYTYMGGGEYSSGGGNKHDRDGWLIYDVQREFLRMGIGSHPADSSLGLSLIHPRRKCHWRLDQTSNAKFEFSPTYPAAFWVPLELTDKELAKVKSFRSKGRLPALVYNYSDLLDYQGLNLHPLQYPDTVILRSAQPNVGWTFGRCQADEKLLELAEVRVIIDARPYANAVANQAKGGGYENAENYHDCRIEFMNIENIHVMRNALEKLLDTLKANHLNSYNTGASTQVGDEFWGALQQSGWLKHVRILLEGAIVCANYVKNGVSILIHCSDGWDRTSQLTSLAQIILDPFYRTRTGFGVLVEKEWISFGHQFQKRCGHGEKDTHHADERSPIFFQFLDATWQIMQQFPFAFEFNSEYLSAIADHLYSNKFGTFLGDNERLRQLDRVRECTQSLWTEVNSESKRKQFKNPLYGKGGTAVPSGAHVSHIPNNPSMDLKGLSGSDLGKASFLHVSADPRKIGIWTHWYRWERRKQGHAPPLLIHTPGMVQSGSHFHHGALQQVISYAHSTLAGEKSRSQLREGILFDQLSALEADVQRMDALLRTQSTELNTMRKTSGHEESIVPVPQSYRHSVPWKAEMLQEKVNKAMQEQHQAQAQVVQHAPSANSYGASQQNASSGPPPIPSASTVRSGPPPVPAAYLPPNSSPRQQQRKSVSSLGPPPLNESDDEGATADAEDRLDTVTEMDQQWEATPLPHGRDSFVSNPLLFAAHRAAAFGSQTQDDDDNELLGDEDDGEEYFDGLATNAVDARKRSILGPGAPVKRSIPPPVPGVALSGMIPPSIPTRHRCLYGFDPNAAGQVHMARGEIVEVHEKGTLGWWKIRNQKGELGMAPANRIEQIPQTDTATTSTGNIEPVVPSPSSTTMVESTVIMAGSHESYASYPTAHTQTNGTSAPIHTGQSVSAPSVGPPPLPSSSSAVPSLPSHVPSTDSSASTVSVSGPGAVGPQFRLNANMFTGIKLKTTQKRASTIARAGIALTPPHQGQQTKPSVSSVSHSHTPSPSPSHSIIIPSEPSSAAPDSSPSHSPPSGSPLSTANYLMNGILGDDEVETLASEPSVPSLPQSSFVTPSLIQPLPPPPPPAELLQEMED